MPRQTSLPGLQAGLVIGSTLGGLFGLVIGLFGVFALKVDPSWRLVGMIVGFILGASFVALVGSILGWIMDADSADPPTP